MAEPTGGNTDAVLQMLAAAGVFVGGVIATLLGVRKKSEPTTPAETTSVQASLRAQLDKAELREDLSTLFHAHREAMEGRMRDFESNIHGKIDELSEERRSAVRDVEERVRQLELRGRRA